VGPAKRENAACIEGHCTGPDCGCSKKKKGPKMKGAKKHIFSFVGKRNLPLPLGPKTVGSGKRVAGRKRWPGEG